MSVSVSAAGLAGAFYHLSELELFRPRADFSEERNEVRESIRRAHALAPVLFHAFARDLVRSMSGYCEDGARDPDVLYRAFDLMDEVLRIDYREDHAMMPANAKAERLYESAGAGVQTSYSTILKVLRHLHLPPSAHVVDLGSGFGRVGLMTGLWREDLRFSGYEYVGHRVQASTRAAVAAGLGERIQFIQQDLSALDFELPAADAYYLYDPFSPSTYRQVFEAIEARGRDRSVAVVAKADAREHFLRCVNGSEWQTPELLDEGTLLVIRSRSPKREFDVF